MREPLVNLQETEKFRSTLDKVTGKNKYILQFYGVPGSGKSQLVRFLAEKFPYTEVATSDEPNQTLFIKWHIQCKDTKDDLSIELLKLVEKLQVEGFIEKNTSLKHALQENFRKDQAKHFVKLLLASKVPTLIIVEDPDGTARNLLQHFFLSLNLCCQTSVYSKFHIYVTSRSKSAVISESMPQIECHETVNINGFSYEEAIRFLKGETSDEKNLIKVYEHFGGLPLGLIAAKSYCQCSGLSYSEYLELVNDPESSYDILEDEKEAVLKEYGHSAEDIFQAIVMPFFPNNDATTEATNTLFWKILCCASYFHYDHITRYLLEYCGHII